MFLKTPFLLRKNTLFYNKLIVNIACKKLYIHIITVFRTKENKNFCHQFFGVKKTRPGLSFAE